MNAIFEALMQEKINLLYAGQGQGVNEQLQTTFQSQGSIAGPNMGPPQMTIPAGSSFTMPQHQVPGQGFLNTQ
jgi:hypothetical protein